MIVKLIPCVNQADAKPRRIPAALRSAVSRSRVHCSRLPWIGALPRHSGWREPVSCPRFENPLKEFPGHGDGVAVVARDPLHGLQNVPIPLSMLNSGSRNSFHSEGNRVPKGVRGGWEFFLFGSQEPLPAFAGGRCSEQGFCCPSVHFHFQIGQPDRILQRTIRGDGGHLIRSVPPSISRGAWPHSI